MIRLVISRDVLPTPIIGSSPESNLPDPKRRAEIQAASALIVRDRRMSKIRLNEDLDEPLMDALKKRGVAASVLLGRSIRDDLEVLNNARVVRLNRANGQLAGTKSISMTLHWEQAERFRLAAEASGLSLRTAAELLLRSALLGETPASSTANQRSKRSRPLLR